MNNIFSRDAENKDICENDDQEKSLKILEESSLLLNPSRGNEIVAEISGNVPVLPPTENFHNSDLIVGNLPSILAAFHVNENLIDFKSDEKNETISNFSLDKSETELNIDSLFDIGKYIGSSVNDLIKRQLLLNPWMPPKNYKFPYSVHNKNGKEEKRYASQQHLNNFNWLVISEIKKGYFCKYCPFFVNNAVGGNVPLKSLVTQPLLKFDKVLGRKGILVTHEQSIYHKKAVSNAKLFLNAEMNPGLSIINQIDSQRLRQIEENRSRLKPIIETIIFLGRQNIPFRGHRDDGFLELENPVENEGNFRELLRFRVQSGDSVLKEHLKKSSSRATYISKITQNEIIQCCGEEILSKLINRILNSKFWSIMFDETTDISQISQMTLVIRSFHENKVYEDFVGFLDLHKEVTKITNPDKKLVECKLSGVNLGKVALEVLKKLELNIEFCVGISTDSCSVMVSDICGAVATIREKAVNAVPTPCYNHKVNNSISKSSNVQAIRNAVGTMKEVISFFTASSKLNFALLSVMGQKLSGLCETRWSERHDGVQQFEDLLPEIIATLDHISSWKDSKTSSKAKSLSIALCDSEFLVALVSLSDLLNLTKSLSQFFQKINIDVKVATDLLQDVLNILNKKREKAEIIFKLIFEKVSDLAKLLETEIKIPRIAKSQVHRSNYSTSDPEIYYRQSVYIPMIESVVVDLKTRFPEETVKLYYFSTLFPDSAYLNDNKLKEEASNQLAEKYHVFFNKPMRTLRKIIETELDLWKKKWEREKYDCTMSAIQLIDYCDEDIYPTLHTLFRIFITLPISNASPERTFSVLKRLKTWLRATMAEDRLIGLALMNIHHNLKINIDNVIDRYAKTKKHRLEFVV